MSKDPKIGDDEKSEIFFKISAWDGHIFFCFPLVLSIFSVPSQAGTLLKTQPDLAGKCQTLLTLYADTQFTRLLHELMGHSTV